MENTCGWKDGAVLDYFYDASQEYISSFCAAAQADVTHFEKTDEGRSRRCELGNQSPALCSVTKEVLVCEEAEICACTLEIGSF